MLSRLSGLWILILALSVVVINASEDPVVISITGLEVPRSEFEHRFGISMVIQAIQSGTPVKDQNQIQAWREQFLEQRVNELVLLQEAKRRNLLISDERLATKVAEYIETMDWQGNLDGNLEMIGFRDKSEFVEMIQERQLLQLLITDLENHFVGTGLEGIDLRQAVQMQIRDFREKYNAVTYPERLVYRY